MGKVLEFGVRVAGIALVFIVALFDGLMDTSRRRLG